MYTPGKGGPVHDPLRMVLAPYLVKSSGSNRLFVRFLFASHVLQAAPPAIRQANNLYAKNIHKRGFVKPTLKEKPSKYPVGPILLGFFVFVVLGSSIFEIFSRKV
ncbi:hypothetical protein HDU86_003587 [Geranomyces michiganensis]|nr:hypothetical protein HDU86_003587 [Geranomyces michiganensis]